MPYYLTKKGRRKVAQALEDIKHGRVYSKEQVKKMLAESDKRKGKERRILREGDLNVG